MIILVDGHDRRCIGCSVENFEEHTEVKKINALVISMLPSAVYLSSDIAIGGRGLNCPSWTLSWKVRIINSLSPDLVIETHLNAFSDSKVSGCETLYYPENDNEKIAKMIQFEIVSKIGNRDRGVKAREDLFILRRTHCPTFIIEPLFITNPLDRELLKTPEIIAQGIVSAFKELKKYFHTVNSP